MIDRKGDGQEERDRKRETGREGERERGREQSTNNHHHTRPSFPPPLSSSSLQGLWQEGGHDGGVGIRAQVAAGSKVGTEGHEAHHAAGGDEGVPGHAEIVPGHVQSRGPRQCVLGSLAACHLWWGESDMSVGLRIGS